MKRILLGLMLALGLMAATPAEATPACEEAPAAQSHEHGKGKGEGHHKHHGHKHGKKKGAGHHKDKQGLRAQVAQLDAQGKLSRKERAVLERDLEQLRELKQGAKQDGVITAAEKARLKLARQQAQQDLEWAASS
jgi:hypothetical protein